MIAFAGVCKSWKESTETYHLKIGVEPMEGGGERKLNVAGFLSYLEICGGGPEPSSMLSYV